MQRNKEVLKIQLERGYRRLQKYFHDFNYLKQSLAMLDNTGRNPDVARRLARLESFFPAGITELEREVTQDMKVLDNKLKQLETQLKHAKLQSQINRGEY